MELFEIDVPHNNHMIFFLKHKSKMISAFCVFKFLRRSVDEKHLMRFNVQPLFQFPPAYCGWSLK